MGMGGKKSLEEERMKIPKKAKMQKQQEGTDMRRVYEKAWIDKSWIPLVRSWDVWIECEWMGGCQTLGALANIWGVNDSSLIIRDSLNNTILHILVAKKSLLNATKKAPVVLL